MSKTWTQAELQKASSAMQEMGEMSYEEFCEKIEEDTKMTNLFERTYERMQEAIKAYRDEASTVEEQETATRKYEAIVDELEMLTKEERTLWRWYENSRDHGNDYLDIEEPISEKDIEEMVAIMKKLHIEDFTVSSTWSSTIEMLYNIQKQPGCSLAGWTMINRSSKRTAPACLFHIC